MDVYVKRDIQDIIEAAVTNNRGYLKEEIRFHYDITKRMKDIEFSYESALNNLATSYVFPDNLVYSFCYFLPTCSLLHQVQSPIEMFQTNLIFSLRSST